MCAKKKPHFRKECEQESTTPWKVSSVPSVSLDGTRSNQVTVTSSEGNTIAVIGRNSEADAKHIVRAVNAHQELLDIIDVLLEHATSDVPNSVIKRIGKIVEAEGK